MRRPTRGQSLVELALLLPLLLLFLMMILDLGRAVYYYSVIHNAAREGARYGIVHYHNVTTSAALTASIITTAKELAIGIDPADLTITTPGIPAFPIETGDILVVKAEYSFSAVTPLVNLFIDGGFIDLSSTSTMYFEK
jgi:Flp pilus assembly protein TadG